MQRRYIRISELASTPARAGRYPCNPSTIWRWVKEGKFPKPVKISDGVTAWDLEAIEAHDRAMAAGEAKPSAIKAGEASVIARAKKRVAEVA